MNIIKKILIVSLAGASLVSCKFLEVEPDVIQKENFFNNENELRYGLAGVYGVINSLELYGRDYSLWLFGVDDLSYYTRSSATQFSVKFQHDASTIEIYNTWVWLYKGINNANVFIESAPSSLDKNGVFVAEARFLRAYYHFLLAQAWGDVPLMTKAVETYEGTNVAATPQYDVLAWVEKEMAECLPKLSDDLSLAPSRVIKTTAQGILARVCLFIAGNSVKRPDGVTASSYYKKAKDYAETVINSGKHALNPSYPDVFINMIADKYDRTYYESMWEADFVGDRSSSDKWSNGTIGTMIGLQSTGVDPALMDKYQCNYSYAMFDGSLKLWDLYWKEDRTEDEYSASTVTDVRQEWNLPPYNYAGNANTPMPYGWKPTEKEPTPHSPVNSVDKTPYVYRGVSTNDDPLVMAGNRNCGKWRRETCYEGNSAVAKAQFTQINFPILRYSDILLMYAEADLELNGYVSSEAFSAVKLVRDRAGIKTLEEQYYGTESFRQLIRNERARELCFEATRRFDLVRWGIFEEAMKDYSNYAGDTRWDQNSVTNYAIQAAANVQHRHILLPIPAIELGVNKLLKQNELW